MSHVYGVVYFKSHHCNSPYGASGRCSSELSTCYLKVRSHKDDQLVQLKWSVWAECSVDMKIISLIEADQLRSAIHPRSTWCRSRQTMMNNVDVIASSFYIQLIDFFSISVDFAYFWMQKTEPSVDVDRHSSKADQLKLIIRAEWADLSSCVCTFTNTEHFNLQPYILWTRRSLFTLH